MRVKSALASLDLADVTLIGAMMSGCILFLLSPIVFNDGDTFWHIATGDWIIGHRTIPRADIFSFTVPGRPWQTHEWLSELVIAAAYRALGWTGVAILFAAVGALVGAQLAGWCSRFLRGWMLPLLVGGGLAITNQSLLARPHILILPLVVAWMTTMLRAREQDRAPGWWSLALLVLWANMHASYALAGVILAAFALEAVLAADPSRRWPVARQWGLFGLGALAAVCVTPFGPRGLLFPVDLMSMSILFDIEEWLPVSFARPGIVEISILGAVFALVSTGARMTAVRLLLLLLFLHMALQHLRQLTVLGVTAPLLMAEPLARAAHAPLDPPRRDWRPPAAAFAVLFLALCGYRLVAPVAQRNSPVAPIAAIDAVGPGLRGRPVFNDYAAGGYLIFRGVRPYIDGRADMYGEDFVADYMALIRRPDPGSLSATLDRRGVAWTLFPPGSPVVATLDGMPGWRRLYADRWAVVHVRAQGS